MGFMDYIDSVSDKVESKIKRTMTESATKNTHYQRQMVSDSVVVESNEIIRRMVDRLDAIGLDEAVINGVVRYVFGGVDSISITENKKTVPQKNTVVRTPTQVFESYADHASSILDGIEDVAFVGSSESYSNCSVHESVSDRASSLLD